MSHIDGDLMIIGFHNNAAGRSLSVLQDVYKSESDTNQRNQAIGALMLAHAYIKDNWQQAVDLYTRQCSASTRATWPRWRPRWRPGEETR
jgi:glutaminase